MSTVVDRINVSLLRLSHDLRQTLLLEKQSTDRAVRFHRRAQKAEGQLAKAQAQLALAEADVRRLVREATRRKAKTSLTEVKRTLKLFEQNAEACSNHAAPGSTINDDLWAARAAIWDACAKHMRQALKLKEDKP